MFAPPVLRRRPPRVCASAFCFLLGFAGLSAGAEKQEFLCVTDRVDGSHATGGDVRLIGWAADPARGTPVPKIEIFLDGSNAGEAVWGGEWRLDVMAHYWRPDYLRAGWSGTVKLDGVSPGAHSVEAFVVSPKGVRASCGRQEIAVRDAPILPERPPVTIGAGIVLRTLAILLWLALIGWAPAVFFGARPAGLAAPLLGLALFAVSAELGAALHIRPLLSGALLTALSASAWIPLTRVRRVRLRRPSRAALATFACVVAFAAVGAIPLSVHGEGAVLGDIDDAIRESLLADSINRFGWSLPDEAHGGLLQIRTEWRRAIGRNGGVFLLSALAEVFGTRAHAIHSVAILTAGCLVVLGAGLLARRLRIRPGLFWLVPALTASNSTLVGTLYGQHLGSLFATALLPLFLATALTLAAGRRLAFLPLGLAVAAAWTLYPELVPCFAVAGLLALLIPRGNPARRRLLTAFLLALLVSVAANPAGLARVARSWIALADREALTSTFTRMRTGDIFYFPSLNVVTGLVPYRQDAPAPMNPLRSALIPIATALIVAVCVLGWGRLTSREKRIVLVLGVPLGLALYVNWRLEFPYGFAKFLPVAVPVFSAVFVFLADRLRREGSLLRSPTRNSLVYASLGLTLSLALLSTRHVVRHAARMVPAYDPAFRTLPALAEVIGHDAVIHVEEPLVTRQAWMFYFLESNPVQAPGSQHSTSARHFRLVDHRKKPPPGDATVSSSLFSMVAIPGEAP